jgi:DNA repair exonuclease SbcCD nuclease subunit
MELTLAKHIPHDEAHLYGLCDTHYGSCDCDEELLERDIHIIHQDPAARAVLVGDLLQYDIRSSKGDVYHQKYPPSEQKKRFRHIIEPIADKIEAVIGGNHDEGRTQEDATPIEDICELLGIPYLRGEMLLKIPVGSKEKNGKPAVYTLYAIHGATSGRFIGSKANTLDRLKDIVLADIYGIAHTHTQHVHKDAYYVPDLRNNNVIEITRYYVNFGSYQRRGEYPKRKGLPAQVLGTPMIRLSGKEKRISVEI